MYLPHAGYVTVRIQSGQYGATWWEAAAGRSLYRPSTSLPTRGPRLRHLERATGPFS